MKSENGTTGHNKKMGMVNKPALGFPVSLRGSLATWQSQSTLYLRKQWILCIWLYVADLPDELYIQSQGGQYRS